MPTPTKGPRLGGSPSHERMIVANLARSLFELGRIRTTEAKAKRLRPQAERLITFAKKGDLASRRQVLTVVRDRAVVYKLFREIAPRYADRQGGYTRILKLGPRPGDSAPMVLIELVDQEAGERPAAGAEPGRRRRFGRGRSAAEGAGAPQGANRAQRRAAARRRGAAAEEEGTAILAGEEPAEERPGVPTDQELDAGLATPPAGDEEATRQDADAADATETGTPAEAAEAGPSTSAGEGTTPRRRRAGGDEGGAEGD